MTEIGTKLKEIRTMQGMSQKKLYELTGISRSRIQRIENNQKSPTIQELTLIANAFGFEVYDLIPNELLSHELQLVISFRRLVKAYFRHFSSN
ncbi:hypothetical protein BHF71_06780 [Vulcanibacillus modesticaldus]|uniref:HTH cro/C1-type domain-containing protein n=1 Tax=Vulcanibacillus modesticaldus TaxID=337097 RepID=A0A1D2YWN1_9BACI|nr:helix-turn-helix transcriptional regulator [Vulcanibacillus modesticaldus]OEG00056.1 hypothetical protein BHF71_06780 [Vulcanibacillus modesticaldus]